MRIFLGSGHYIYTTQSQQIRFSNIHWPDLLPQWFRRSSRSFSKLLLLQAAPACRPQELTSTSQPTLGVLFFPLSPPSCKGATHNQRVLAPQLASKAELPLTICWGFPTPTRKSVSLLFSAIAFQSQPKTQKRPLSSPSPIPLTPQNPNSPFP